MGELPQRFMDKVKVDEETGCWIWQGAFNAPGRYGRLRNEKGVMELAHRFAYRITTGINPGKRKVRHQCHTPACVNPEHLKIGTQKHNMADMKKAGNGHWQRYPERARESGRRLLAKFREKRGICPETSAA